MKALEFSICFFASVGLSVAQPVSTTPNYPDSTGRTPSRVQGSTESKNPLVVRIDPARVLDSSGLPVGKVENIVLNPSGCADAAIITSERGRMIPVPWQAVKLSGETRGQGDAPGTGLTFTVNANNERILTAPSFARDEWPNVSSVSWLQPSVQFFRSETAVGGTSDTSGTSLGTSSSSVTFTNAAGVVITNSVDAVLPPTGRPGLPSVPPAVPESGIPVPPAPVPPSAVPQGSLPAPVTPPPPSSVPPQTFPRPANPAGTVP